jgi:hypothetical protein
VAIVGGIDMNKRTNIQGVTCASLTSGYSKTYQTHGRKITACATGMVALSLASCATAQLNNNTLEVGSTVDDVVTNQIVYNLARYLRDPTANPSQASIPSGSVTTTNQAALSVSAPFNTAATATTQLSTAAGAIIPAITRISSGVLGATTITPSLNNQASQSLSVTPNTDSDQERRLRALYRYAAYNMGSNELCSEYSLIVTQASVEVGKPGSGKTASAAASADPNSNQGDFNKMTVIAKDSQFLREPSCVICSQTVNTGNVSYEGPRITKDKKKEVCPGDPDLYVNQRLKTGWLKRAEVGAAAPDSWYPIGTDLGFALYTSNAEDYRQFVLFVLEATNLGSAAGQSGKSGSSKGGAGLANVPYGGAVPLISSGAF